MTTIAIPVELLPVDETATLPALEQFEREYEGQVCAVCQSHKWSNSPFCRLCSIRLQRTRMMRDLQAQMDHYGRDWAKWPAFVLRNFWRHYDTCRDFLINTKRSQSREEN